MIAASGTLTCHRSHAGRETDSHSCFHIHKKMSGSDQTVGVKTEAVGLGTSNGIQETQGDTKKRHSELALEEEQLSNKRHESAAAVANGSEKTAEENNDAKNTNNAIIKDSTDINKKKESSSREVDASDSKPFGGRILTDESAVFEQNAW